jgi:parallel beta-helix repeat protein
VASPSSKVERRGGREPAPEVGALLADRYRLTAARRGRPGRFEATDEATGKSVFVKIGPPDGALAREASLLGRADHPGLVRLVEAGAAGGRSFLVLEWVEGADLEARLSRPPEGFADDGLIRLLGKLADAVAAIHAAGWLHRDLKPANVMVRADGDPVIVDLGAALPIGQAADPPPDSDLTEGYAAPEQYLSDRPEGPWTDAYGLGAIGYRALFGRPPLPAPARLRGEAMPHAMEQAGRHAEAWCRAIDWALTLDPAGRPQTVLDWSAAFALPPDDAASPTDPGPMPATLDDYPDTVRVRRAPRARVAPPAPGAPAGPIARTGRRRGGALVAATLLLVGASVVGAGWYGRPLYERYLKTEWMVDSSGGGDALSIADAIARARVGATIAIRPGTYRETLSIERPVHLVPAMPETPPLIAPGAGACVLASSGGSISGLRFAGAAATGPEEAPAPCLVLAHANLRVAGNHIAGGAGPAILVQDGGAPVIAGNVIENGAGPGIVIAAGASPEITGNTIRNTGRSALIARGGAAPAVTDNAFEASGGLVFAEGAAGRLANNRITEATTSAIEITSGADPIVIDNTIERPAGAGVFVYDHGRGRIERNVIIGSRLSGIVIAAGGDALAADNAIRESAEHGVLVVEGGCVVLERNAIADNEGNGIVVDWEGEAELSENEVTGNAEPQVLDARVP